MNAKRIAMLLVVLVGGWMSIGSTPVVAITDDPQPCDTAAQMLTVTAPEAFVHTEPSLQAQAPATVNKGMLLGVVGSQVADDVGCWYQVTALQVTAQAGQPALPVPAWIAGSTVNVVARQAGTAVPAVSPVPTATPQAPYSVPNAATPPSTSRYDGVPIAPTYAPGTAYAPPYTAPGYGGVPQTPGTVPSVSPIPTAISGIDALVRRVVATRVCLDRNANTFCDLDEGVAGVPAYVVDPSGQVLAATRTDSGGVASAAIEAPRTAQLTINVPYLNAFQRVTGTGETAPILVPMNAPLPGAMP